MTKKISFVLILAVLSGFWSSEAFAQVPPHAPGTICFTPTFWCWATSPGLPGYPCICIDRNGQPVQGTLN